MILQYLSFLWTKQWFRYVAVGVSSAALAAAATTALYPSEKIREEAYSLAKTQAESEYQATTKELVKSSKEEIRVAKNESNEAIQKLSETNSEMSKKIASLTTENTQLKTKRKVETVIIKDASGREETRISDNTESESSTQKTQQIVTELTEKYEQKIKEVEQKSVMQITSERAKSAREVDSLKVELAASKTLTETLQKQSKVTETNPKKMGVGVGYTTDRKYSTDVSYDFWGPVYGQVSVDSDFKDYRGRIGLGVRF